MTDLRKAAQQALEALEDLADCGTEAWSEQRPCVQIGREAITALRAALEQEQAEPDHETRAELAEQQVVQLAEERDHYRNLWQKAQQAEPLNLADPAVRKRLASQWGYVPAAAQAEPVQEPVAWSGYDLDGMVEAFSRVIEAHYQRANPFQHPIDMDAQMALRILRGFIPAMKAYPAPPQRKPLTEEDISAIDWKAGETLHDFARAVEQAAWEKNNG